MKEFDEIIGYEYIKTELVQIIDMMINEEVYTALGARMPKGVILYGNPGVGKTMFANAFLRACGRESFVIRKAEHGRDFIDRIKETFNKAAINSPSVILLDDLDKFVSDERCSEEYTVIQSFIDEKTNDDVFIIATANDSLLPPSLKRPGRFDRELWLEAPVGDDAVRIIKHYLSNKKMVADVNEHDIAGMLEGGTSAQLETAINEASIIAGYERSKSIEMKHLVKSYLRHSYDEGFDENGRADLISPELLKEIAYHEAGHVCLNEIAHPGCVGIVSISGRKYEGFTKTRFVESFGIDNRIISVLAGREAVSVKFGEYDGGSAGDIAQVRSTIRNNMELFGRFGAGLVSVFDSKYDYDEKEWQLQTAISSARTEAAFQAILAVYVERTRKLVVENMDFIDAVANALIEKRYLLSSDLKGLREKYLSNKKKIA